MRYGKFYLTAVTFNLGRGYPTDAVFVQNVQRVLRLLNRHEKYRDEPYALLPQEIDEEPDLGKEHDILERMLEPDVKKVFWHSHEPIILSPHFQVKDRRRVVTMGSGKEINPKFDGVGPRRYGITCVGEFEGVLLGFGNTHPHRKGLHPEVEAARLQGQGIFAEELRRLKRSNGGISGIWGADMNDDDVPPLVGGERVAVHQRLDHLRYWNHHDGAKLRLIDKGVLSGSIDPHNPLWARFLVEAR